MKKEMIFCWCESCTSWSDLFHFCFFYIQVLSHLNMAGKMMGRLPGQTHRLKQRLSYYTLSAHFTKNADS